MACEDIKQRLDDAIAAKHRLMTGAQVVVIVDAFRSRVEYRAADADKLTEYIQLTQAQYQACINANTNSVCPLPNVLTRPVRFIF